MNQSFPEKFIFIVVGWLVFCIHTGLSHPLCSFRKTKTEEQLKNSDADLDQLQPPFNAPSGCQRLTFCLLVPALSLLTSVTYISVVNIIETGPWAGASCSEIRNGPKDERPPGLALRKPASQGESQVIYRKVEEHE